MSEIISSNGTATETDQYTGDILGNYVITILRIICTFPMFNPTFRSKFHVFTIFAAIDFQFDVNLLDFCAGIKRWIYVHLETKDDSIKFSSSSISILDYLNVFQKRYRKK